MKKPTKTPHKTTNAKNTPKTTNKTKASKSTTSAADVVAQPTQDNAPAPKDTAPSLTEQLDLLAQEVQQAFQLGDLAQVKQIIHEKVLPLTPNNPIALHHLAIAELSLGNLEQAYHTATVAAAHSADDYIAHIYDTLVEITQALQHFEESQYYARLSIANKKNRASTSHVHELPKRKRKGLHSDKTKNIISFSLFGNTPRYCETAILNAALAQTIYPNWTCRFYLDNTVPSDIIERLQQHDVQIVMMNDELPAMPKSLWRLLVALDKEVHCFMIRNADALLSHKEAAAVNAWLESKKYFHILRDSLKHHEPMLAGMWAGYTDTFDNLHALIQQFFGQDGEPKSTQQFFNTIIYPIVAQSVLIHDSHHLDDNSLPYPSYAISDIEKTPNFHIGMVDANIHTITLHLPEPCQQIHWQLLNENAQIICQYDSLVYQTTDNQFVAMLNLPYIYGQKIHNQDWKINYHILVADQA